MVGRFRRNHPNASIDLISSTVRDRYNNTKVTEQDFQHYINYAVSIVQPCIAEISTPDTVYPDLTDQVVTTEEAQIAMELIPLQGRLPNTINNRFIENYRGALICLQ